jgi:uncharacterized protein YxeA
MANSKLNPSQNFVPDPNNTFGPANTQYTPQPSGKFVNPPTYDTGYEGDFTTPEAATAPMDNVESFTTPTTTEYAEGQLPPVDPVYNQDYVQDYSQINRDELMNEQQSIAENTTFEEKKGGNRFFYIILGVIILILIIAAGALFWINLNKSNELKKKNEETSQVSTTSTTNSNSTTSTTTTPVEKPKSEKFDKTKTGGDNSPASVALQNESTEVTTAWLQQYFVTPFVDAQGNCVNATVCGNTADPDNDKLVNLSEYNFGTNPQSADDDKDGITDGDELFKYYTNPTKTDSDADGFTDFNELAACYDPISTAKGKMDKARLDKISNVTSLTALSKGTSDTFKTKNATAIDLQRGYIMATCDAAAPTTTPAPSTVTNPTTTKPN